MTQKEWIERSRILHNDYYDYSTVVYTASKNKVLITCPVHGVFSQVANSHLLGHGCAKCAKKIQFENTQKDRNKNFIDKLLQRGFDFDYSKTIFIDSKTPVIVTCKIHGDIQYKPNALLHENCKGCVKCNTELRVLDKNKKLLEVCKEIHNHRYDYSLTDLTIKKKDLVTVICPEHGEFKTTLLNHSKGSKCTYCMNEERSYRARYNRLGIPATLYLCYFKDLNLYKIGVTVNLKHRFRGEKQAYEVIYTKDYNNEAEAYYVENKLLSKFSKYKYTKSKPLTRGGNLELITLDVSQEFTSSVETIENTDEFKNICSK